MEGEMLTCFARLSFQTSPTIGHSPLV